MHCRRDTIARIAAAGRRGAAMLPTHAGSAAKAAAFVALAALAYMGLQWANPLGVSSPALVTQTREPYKPKKLFDQVTNDRMAWVFDSFGVDRPVTDQDVARLLLLPEGLEGFSHRQVVGMDGLTAAEVLRGDYSPISAMPHAPTSKSSCTAWPSTIQTHPAAGDRRAGRGGAHRHAASKHSRPTLQRPGS